MNSELIDNIELVITFLFAIKIIAVAIVNLTPTPEDNKWLGHFYKALEVVAGIITKTAKELPGERSNPDKRVSMRSSPKDGSDGYERESKNDPFGAWSGDN